MSWWMGLDRDIYVDAGDVRRRFEARPYPEEGPPSGPLRPDGARPTAVLARQIASPSYEVLWFARVARRHGFRPLVIEHRSDRFTVHNSYKRSLATLPLRVGRSHDGRSIIRRQKVVDLAAAEGRPLEEIRTLRGEPFLDYHHRKLVEVMGEGAPEVIDLQDVLPCAGGPGAYYLEFFKMLSQRLVLFEDFVADDQTASFFLRTVLPAYREAAAATGRAPQIARLVPGRRTSSPFWMAYPAAVADDPTWVLPSRPRVREGVPPAQGYPLVPAASTVASAAAMPSVL